MYRALWRILPGPVAMRVLTLVVMAVVFLISLDQWVFPWFAATFVDTEATVGASS